TAGFGWGDLRSRVEGALMGFKFDTISFDKTLIRAMSNTIGLTEQTKYKSAKIDVCIDRFDITRLNMTRQTQTQVDLDLRVKVYLTIEGREQNQRFLVQELGGSIRTVTPFYWLYYDGTARVDNLLRGPWD